MRASSTVAVLATSLVGLIGALLVEGTTPTCAIKASNGEFVFCPYTSDCNVSTQKQPVCRGGDGKYIKGDVGGSCYLVNNHNDPNDGSTLTCSFHCSSTNGVGGSSCM